MKSFNIQFILLALVIGFGAGGFLGWDYRGDHEQAKQVDVLVEIQEEHEKQVLVEIAAALKTERSLQDSRVTFAVNRKEIQSYANSNKINDTVCFNNHDIGLWNKSSKASAKAGTSKLFSKMSIGIFAFNEGKQISDLTTARWRFSDVPSMQNKTQRLSGFVIEAPS